MLQIFKTVLLLSFLGTFLIILMLVLKPVFVKNFPAKIQVIMWILIAISMCIPFWKMIPKDDAKKITPKYNLSQTDTKFIDDNIKDFFAEDNSFEDVSFPIINDTRINVAKLLLNVWLFGICIFLMIIVISYVRFVLDKRKNSENAQSLVFDEVKKLLHIKRNIRLKISKSVFSPCLVGCIFPIVYSPHGNIENKTEKMIFMHELTHYKQKALLIKWLFIFVSAIHWFNPFVYLMLSNISQSLEVSCDMAVVKKLSDDEKTFYMNTILDLIENEKRRIKND
ncbi:MAG: M56 family metallopeptidase [Ruminococcaceae bacterium]|nr:M56 family metallopeptidase [Oscillospiraceae bacterium]